MSGPRKHGLQCVHCTSLHPHWDRSLPPAHVVADGAVVTMTCPDASNGLLGPKSTSQDIAAIDFTQLDPLCGPIYIEGAEPGDAVGGVKREAEFSGHGAGNSRLESP